MSDIETQKQALRDELEKLKYEFKIELPKKISEARSYGDLKENAEYHAARERQSFVKARIGQLTQELTQLNNFDLSAVAKDRIATGSTVTVLDLDSDDQVEFTFVNPNEVNPSEGKISISSPIGMALRDRKVGDLVEVNIPAGKRRYQVKKFITIHGDAFTGE